MLGILGAVYFVRLVQSTFSFCKQSYRVHSMPLRYLLSLRVDYGLCGHRIERRWVFGRCADRHAIVNNAFFDG